MARVSAGKWNQLTTGDGVSGFTLAHKRSEMAARQMVPQESQFFGPRPCFSVFMLVLGVQVVPLLGETRHPKRRERERKRRERNVEREREREEKREKPLKTRTKRGRERKREWRKRE